MYSPRSRADFWRFCPARHNAGELCDPPDGWQGFSDYSAGGVYVTFHGYEGAGGTSQACCRKQQTLRHGVGGAAGLSIASVYLKPLAVDIRVVADCRLPGQTQLPQQDDGNVIGRGDNGRNLRCSRRKTRNLDRRRCTFDKRVDW